MESEKFDGMTEAEAELLAKQMGNSLAGQMEQLRKASDEFCKTAILGAKSIMFNSLTKSLIFESQKYGISQSLLAHKMVSQKDLSQSQICTDQTGAVHKSKLLRQ